MPGRDGTGPNGMGAMTGGRRGFCVEPGDSNLAVGRRFFRRGSCFFGRGLGFGRGRRGWFADTNPYVSAPVYSAKEEAIYLKNQAKVMEEELKAVQERISALEKREGE